MMTLDRFERIADEAQFPIAIVGNPAASQFTLIDLSAKPSRETIQKFADCGLDFIGVFGIVDGTPRVALNEPLDEPTMAVLSQALVKYVEAAIKAAPWIMPIDKRRN